MVATRGRAQPAKRRLGAVAVGHPLHRREEEEEAEAERLLPLLLLCHLPLSRRRLLLALRRRLVLLPRRLLPLSVLVAGLVVGGSFVGSQSLVAWKRVPRGTLLCFVSGRAESWAHNLSEHP